MQPNVPRGGYQGVVDFGRFGAHPQSVVGSGRPMAYGQGGFLDESYGGGMEEDWAGARGRVGPMPSVGAAAAAAATASAAAAYAGAQAAGGYAPYLSAQAQAAGYSGGFPTTKPPTFPPPQPPSSMGASGAGAGAVGSDFGFGGGGGGGGGGEDGEFPALGGRQGPSTPGRGPGGGSLMHAQPPPPPSQAPHVPPSQPPVPQGPPPLAPPLMSPPSQPAHSGRELTEEERKKEERLYLTTPEAQQAAREQYGLLGILKVIRMTDPDLNMLALGMDLTTLGLNLNSAENLYSTFASPWSDTPLKKENDFYMPACYYQQPPQLKTAHLQKFSQETLFYIFFNMPRDILQAYAAAELYNRGYKYHRDLKAWFGLQDERGETRWTIFDPNTWEKQFYDQHFDPAGFLTEDDVRVKILPFMAPNA